LGHHIIQWSTACPSIHELVEKIRKNELNDLYLLGAKGGLHPDELLDEGDSTMIPTIALVDRTFQQRRWLDGTNLGNINSLTAIIEASICRRSNEKAEEAKKV